MGALDQRRVGLKTAWRNQTVRRERAEAFAWITVVTLLYRNGNFKDREEALEMLFQKVTAEDLREYRKVNGADGLYPKT